MAVYTDFVMTPANYQQNLMNNDFTGNNNMFVQFYISELPLYVMLEHKEKKTFELGQIKLSTGVDSWSGNTSAKSFLLQYTIADEYAYNDPINDPRWITFQTVTNNNTRGKALTYDVNIPKAKAVRWVITTSNHNSYITLSEFQISKAYIDCLSQYEKNSLDQVTEIGDVISCEYTATSGTFGVFANLGQATKPFIPKTGSLTPDGSFYWIFVGYDHLGRKKFVADRNIQYGISWSALNMAGAVFGLRILENAEYPIYTRLLTAGIGSYNSNTEWGQYICESTLNGRIEAGLDDVWGWNFPSLTMTSYSSYFKNVCGGTTAKTVSTQYASDSVSNLFGYRPMMIAESPPLYYLIKTPETGKIFKVNSDGSLIDTGLINNITQEQFEMYGTTNLNKFSNEAIQTIIDNGGKYRVLVLKK